MNHTVMTGAPLRDVPPAALSRSSGFPQNNHSYPCTILSYRLTGPVLNTGI
jgi:hypothetical protein